MIESFKHNGKTIEIHADEDPMNPRTECDNASTMICFHKRYALGDKHDYKQSDFNGWEELKERICKDNDVQEILPIYMYDHSGITISTTPFSCPWDSGQIGYIFLTKKQARECYMVRNITKKIAKKAHNLLLADVECYDQYLTNDVYGYVVKDENDNKLDSCWGLYGIEYAREEAKEAAN